MFIASRSTTPLNKPVVWRTVACAANDPSTLFSRPLLVHEAYIRLIGQEQPDYRSRAHFLGVAAHLMRQILADHARSRSASKRGGGQPARSVDKSIDAAVERPMALIAVDDALATLERTDRQKAQLVEMRFFGGLTAEESADVLQLPVEKVRSELRIAQAWLQRELDRRAAP